MTDRYRNTTLSLYPKQREKEAALQTYFLCLWATQNHELYLWIFSRVALLYFENVCLGSVTICYRMFHRHVMIIICYRKKNCIWQDHQMLYWDNLFTLHIYTVQFFQFIIKLSSTSCCCNWYCSVIFQQRSFLNTTFSSMYVTCLACLNFSGLFIITILTKSETHIFFNTSQLVLLSSLHVFHTQQMEYPETQYAGFR